MDSYAILFATLIIRRFPINNKKLFFNMYHSESVYYYNKSTYANKVSMPFLFTWHMR